MAVRKKTTKALVRAAAPARGSRGKTREGAIFPVSPPRAGLPRDYAETLSEIKQRIQAERLRVVMAANAEMRAKIGAVCREAGYEPPVICTPEELMGD